MGAAGVADLAHFIGGRLDDHEQEVVPLGLQTVGDIDATLGIHALVLGNLLAVKEDDGLVIDTVENQDTALVSAWSWGGEAALVDPPAVGDPFAVEAVELDVRVLDQAGAQQVVVDAAGHLGRNTGGDPAHGEAGLHALTKQRRPGPEACYGPVG